MLRHDQANKEGMGEVAKARIITDNEGFTASPLHRFTQKFVCRFGPRLMSEVQ
jgi:hypothetical protein